MKKLLLIISMLAVIFSMSACSEETTKAFDYNEDQLISEVESLSGTFFQFSDEEIVSYEEGGTDLEKSLAKGIEQTRETDKITSYGEFDSSKAVVEDNGESVSVTVVNKAIGRDIEVTVIFKENKGYNIKLQEIRKTLRNAITGYEVEGYTEQQVLEMAGYSSFEDAVTGELALAGFYPYDATEAEVNAVYSRVETMKQAGMNTLIGMGTVFAVLIFISFVISLMKYIPMILDRKSKNNEVAVVATTAKQPLVVKPVVDNDLMNNNELVAVITAAIYAASASSGATSNDTLIVRSIKRARR